MIEARALQPLSYGNVLIVGAKSSNFDPDLLSNPRVILWSSQESHWTDKELPVNVRAVFITKWIGHNDFDKILKEARKKKITIFNQEGTGRIAQQVKELLAINPPQLTPKLEPQKQEETMIVPITSKPQPPNRTGQGKLALLEHIVDYSQTNIANARAMLVEAEKLGISTTLGSLCQFLVVLRRRQGQPNSPKTTVRKSSAPKIDKLDISVAVLDDAIKQLKDVRDYLISTAKENTELKARVAKLRKTLED